MKTSKGVWLSKELIKDKNLSWTKKIILQEIEQLSDLEHGCIANNRHFAELLGISKSAVSMALKELEADGYIEIDNSEVERNFGRKITIKNTKKDGVKQTEQGLSKLNRGVKQTEHPPIKQTEQSKDTKTNKTKTKENNTPLPPKLKEWIEYRKSIKKKLSDLSIEKLRKRHDENHELFSRSVDYSIENGYSGLFAPDTKKFKSANEPEAGSIGWYEQQYQDGVCVDVEAEQ